MQICALERPNANLRQAAPQTAKPAKSNDLAPETLDLDGFSVLGAAWCKFVRGTPECEIAPGGSPYRKIGQIKRFSLI